MTSEEPPLPERLVELLEQSRENVDKVHRLAERAHVAAREARRQADQAHETVAGRSDGGEER